ncbi:MAG: transcription elongation factor GreB [Gammaproteobacteria bacterium]|nr:transcription elongation factor GreB [Gammaproteobacteria bacterium]
MSRYRPPRAKGSPYITPEGAQRLREELNSLWKIERPQVTATVHAAALNGDRSENGDYIYGKKRLREIDSRVRFLQKRLDELHVVDTKPADTGRIFFGCWIGLEDTLGVTHNYRIVGPDEFDLNQGLLSCDSPLGKALLGKTSGETVHLKTPEGETEWQINSLTYD